MPRNAAGRGSNPTRGIVGRGMCGKCPGARLTDGRMAFGGGKGRRADGLEG